MNNIEERARKLGLSKEVYVFLRKSGRKIRYFTYDLKYDAIIINDEDIVFIPRREDSLDRLKDEGIMFAAEEKSVEDIVIDNILREQLREALSQLSNSERRLIDEIFFSRDGEGKTEREAAKSLGIPRMTLNDRKTKILLKLKNLIEK